MKKTLSVMIVVLSSFAGFSQEKKMSPAATPLVNTTGQNELSRQEAEAKKQKERELKDPAYAKEMLDLRERKKQEAAQAGKK